MPMAERSVLPVPGVYRRELVSEAALGELQPHPFTCTPGVLTIGTGVGFTVLGLPCKWHTGLLR